MSNLVAVGSSSPTPALIVAAGDRAAHRFLEFFTAQIRNSHTRRAYVRAVGAFCAWLEAHGVPSIAAVGSMQVAGYVEDLGQRHSASTVKQHLAAIRCVPGSAGVVGARQAKGPSRNSKVSAQPPAPWSQKGLDVQK